MRVFAFLLQTVFISLFEDGINMFQLRVLIVIWAVSFLKAMSAGMLPFKLMVIVLYILMPLFSLIDKDLRQQA